MAFGEYRGRNIGRLLRFLYEYHMRADHAIFQGEKNDPMVTLGGKPFCNYTWDGDSDVPTFQFLGEWGFMAGIQEIRKKEILASEALMGRKPWTPDEDKPATVEGWKSRGNRQAYAMPIRPGSTITEILGEVWQKNDKRWNWVRKPTTFHPNRPGQGVALTEGQAKLMVEPPTLIAASNDIATEDFFSPTPSSWERITTIVLSNGDEITTR